MPVGPGKTSCLSIWICYTKNWGRTSRRWRAFLILRGCGSSFQRLGNSWCLRASGNSWNAACVRNPRSQLQFPLCRRLVATSAMMFTASSRPSDRPDEGASATAGGVPLRPRFFLHRVQSGFPVEAEGYPATGGWRQSDACLHGSTARSSRTRLTQLRPPTSWTASTSDVASLQGAVI